MNKIFLAANAQGIARAAYSSTGWEISQTLKGKRVTCLAGDPHSPRRVYAGLGNDGVLVSSDAGKTWEAVGLKGVAIRSLAINPHDSQTVYAGCKPASLYITHDGGSSWAELVALREARRWWWFSPAEPPDWNPYVIALTVSPGDPQIIMAGIELGGILRSEDGGKSWSKKPRHALLDCHSLTFHPADGEWVYQGGAGLRSGAAYSQDGGKSWMQPRGGLGGKYGWKVVPDGVRPEVWYLSASRQPNLLRGEFTPPAHRDGQADGHIYRRLGGADWERLSGGLPEPLDYFAYSLVNDPQNSGHLYTGLANGEIWYTQDYGDTWQQLPFSLGSSLREMLVLEKEE